MNTIIFKDFLAIGHISKQENYVLIDSEDFATIKLVQGVGDNDDYDITHYDIGDQSIEDLIQRNEVLNKITPDDEYKFTFLLDDRKQ